MKKGRAVVGTPWWVRLAIYVIVGIVGLVGTVTGFVTTEQVDTWLGQVGSIAALIGGVVAAVFTGRASDETPAEELHRLAPTVEEEAKPTYSAFSREG